MAMSPSSGKASVKAEPNVTPMIDVMLVLLIIFMIIIPALTSGVNAQPPAGQNLKSHPEQDQDQLLAIDANGQYYLNRKPIQNSTLGDALNAIYTQRTEDKILYIKADKNLEYAKIEDALDVASRNGVRMTALISDQTPGTASKVAGDESKTPATEPAPPTGARP